MAFAVIPAARHPLDPCGLTSRGCKIRVMLRAGQSLPPKGLSTLRFDAGRFPPDAGSLLLGLLAATQTGLTPAGEHGLTRGSLLLTTSSHYTVPHAAGHTGLASAGCAVAIASRAMPVRSFREGMANSTGSPAILAIPSPCSVGAFTKHGRFTTTLSHGRPATSACW